MTQGDLKDRMAAFTEGQVTWPDLSSIHRRDACKHFSNEGISARRAVDGYGRCTLAKEFLKKPGKQFIGSSARACLKFEGRN